MKRLNHLLVFLLLAFGSCKEKPFDYRNKYTGSYRMTVHRHYWQMGQQVVDTTWEYDGRVWYSKSDDKRALHCTYSDDAELLLNVDREGQILYSSVDKEIGRFANRKKFVLTLFSGGLGGSSTFTISGKRK
jgi:hypothetical protein